MALTAPPYRTPDHYRAPHFARSWSSQFRGHNRCATAPASPIPVSLGQNQLDKRALVPSPCVRVAQGGCRPMADVVEQSFHRCQPVAQPQSDAATETGLLSGPHRIHSSSRPNACAQSEASPRSNAMSPALIASVDRCKSATARAVASLLRNSVSSTCRSGRRRWKPVWVSVTQSSTVSTR